MDQRVEPCSGRQATRLPFPDRHYLIVWPRGLSLPSLPRLLWMGWFHPAERSPLVYCLCPCAVPWEAQHGRGRHGPSTPSSPSPAHAAGATQSHGIWLGGWQWARHPALVAPAGSRLRFGTPPSRLCPFALLVGRQLEKSLPEGRKMRRVALNGLGRVFPLLNAAGLSCLSQVFQLWAALRSGGGAKSGNGSKGAKAHETWLWERTSPKHV